MAADERLAVRTRAPELTNADLSINPPALARTGTGAGRWVAQNLART
jgi:hypothetical protein